MSIRAVVVLYKMLPAESPALQSLLRLLADDADAASAIHVTLCDNTPGELRSAPAGLAVDYADQPHNPGLASSYNLALEHARTSGATWLLLLDQDTVLTADYLTEVLETARAFEADASVVAAVPKLVEKNTVQSPHFDVTVEKPELLSLDFFGFPDRKLHMYNSGALVRVSSLVDIGGFPSEFWLDFLDHATFHLLRKDGGRIWVMRAHLHHSLSTNAPLEPGNNAYLARHRNVLEAEALYYRKFGTPRERLYYRRRLVRVGLKTILRHRLFRMGWRTLMMATRVRVDG